jgi:hypothetical protein
MQNAIPFSAFNFLLAFVPSLSRQTIISHKLRELNKQGAAERFANLLPNPEVDPVDNVQQPIILDPAVLGRLVRVPADEKLEMGSCGDGGVIHTACNLVYGLALQCSFYVSHIFQGQHSVLSLDIARGMAVVRGAVCDFLTSRRAAWREAALAVAGRAVAPGFLHRTAVCARSTATVHVRSGGRALGAASVVDRLRWGVGTSADVVLEEVIDLNARDLRAPRCQLAPPRCALDQPSWTEWREEECVVRAVQDPAFAGG